MKQVLIMRGVSGSGKSTFTKRHPDAVIVSADHFFDRIGGYDKALIKEAHRECYSNYIQALDAGTPKVIVDNTHIEAWEISPLIAYAEYKGYEYQIVEIPLPDPDLSIAAKICAERNLHGVTERMLLWTVKRFTIAFLPASWNRVQFKEGE